MGIVKIADGAYFVPSYSVQTITRAYSNGDSGLFFAGAYGAEPEDSDDEEKDRNLPVTEEPKI
jgi:hypothetical protein